MEVAAENWIESSGVGSWQMMEESREFSWELKVWLWREEFTWAVVQWYMECVIQWYCYSFCVQIRRQETDSEDCNRLRRSVLAAVKCKVRRFRLLVALQLRVVPSAVYKWSINPIHPIRTPSNSHKRNTFQYDSCHKLCDFLFRVIYNLLHRAYI
jgi:hypothetical protein